VTGNPYTDLDRPYGLQEAQTLRISKQTAHESGKVLSPTHRPPLPPRNFPGSTPGPQCGRIKSVKNPTDTIGNRSRHLPACGAVPQPTAPPLLCCLFPYCLSVPNNCNQQTLTSITVSSPETSTSILECHLLSINM
jgi:hypothetical protein